jgi:kynurenine formamidase
MARLGLVLLTVIAVLAAPAASQGPSVPRETFDGWMTRLSNAGRWGPDDQLGTLNLITPAKRRAAALLVRDGVTVSLAGDVVPGPDPNAIAPFRLGVGVFPLDSTTMAPIDSFTIMAHGYAYSHLDALAHFIANGRLYNGVTRDQIHPEGAAKLGIEQMRAGIVTRGVIIDIPRFKGVPYLDPGAVITTADLETWERRHRVRVGQGDVVLIRVGRAERTKATGPWTVVSGTAGPHPSIALWLRERGVAVLGSDVANERYPSLVPGIVNPMHNLTIAAMGLPLLDDLDLEAVAREAATRSRPTFLFMAGPLRIRGGTGSPVNPIAVF